MKEHYNDILDDLKKMHFEFQMKADWGANTEKLLMQRLHRETKKIRDQYEKDYALIYSGKERSNAS